MDDPAANDSPPLPPRYCGDCGYSLTGLPAAGQCPECGAAFSPAELVLFGWTAGDHASIATSTPRNTKFLVACAVPGVGCMLLAAFLQSWWMVGFWLVALTPTVVLLLRRQHNLSSAPCPVQARISTRGRGQRQGCGRIKFRRWESGDRIQVERWTSGQTPMGIVVDSTASPRSWATFLDQFVKVECVEAHAPVNAQ